jgi:hypothetical protein
LADTLTPNFFLSFRFLAFFPVPGGNRQSFEITFYWFGFSQFFLISEKDRFGLMPHSELSSRFIFVAKRFFLKWVFCHLFHSSMYTQQKFILSYKHNSMHYNGQNLKPYNLAVLKTTTHKYTQQQCMWSYIYDSMHCYVQKPKWNLTTWRHSNPRSSIPEAVAIIIAYE